MGVAWDETGTFGSGASEISSEHLLSSHAIFKLGLASRYDRGPYGHWESFQCFFFVGQAEAAPAQSRACCGSSGGGGPPTESAEIVVEQEKGGESSPASAAESAFFLLRQVPQEPDMTAKNPASE